MHKRGPFPDASHQQVLHSTLKDSFGSQVKSSSSISSIVTTLIVCVSLCCMIGVDVSVCVPSKKMFNFYIEMNTRMD